MSENSADIEQLKSDLGAARKRALNFGFCLASKAEDSAFVTHRIKSAEMLGKAAKKEAGATKLIYGEMTVEGKVLKLKCMEPPKDSMAKKIKDFLKANGIKMSVKLFDANMTALEDDGEPEDENPADTPTAEGDPVAEAWIRKKAELEKDIFRYISHQLPDYSKVKASWAVAVEAGDQHGDPSYALKVAKNIEAIMAAGGPVPGAKGDAAPDGAAKWEAARTKFLPHVAEALKNQTKDTSKIQKLWDFANSKAKADPPDFDGAIKALAMLPGLIAQVRAVGSGLSPEELAASKRWEAAVAKIRPLAQAAAKQETLKDPAQFKALWQQANELAKNGKYDAAVAALPGVIQMLRDAQSTETMTENGPLISEGGAEYAAAYKAKIPAISKVTSDPDLSVIGGADVQAALNKALQLASQKKWAEATAALTNAEENAALAFRRKPYVKARREHGGGIRAGFAIKFPTPGPTYGAQLEELWKQAEKLADADLFDNAAVVLGQAADLLKTAKEDKSLNTQKNTLKAERKKNLDDMKAIVAGARPLSGENLAELKALAIKELKQFSDKAKELGDDAEAPSREPCSDWDGAEKTFKEYDWFQVKSRLHNNEISKENMWDLWRYRQKFVTDLIDKIRKAFPTLIAKASGSADMESDIDITFASPELGKDVEAAKLFNKAIISKFGKPAGRVFDVNIYPRDYNAISESFNADFSVDGARDRNIDQPEGAAMSALSQIDQDVATLLKQRRFLDDDSFHELFLQIKNSIEDPVFKKQVQRQFENGEQIYLTTALEKVSAIVAKVDQKGTVNGKDKGNLSGGEAASLKKVTDLREKFTALQAKGESTDIKDRAAALKEMQVLLPELLDALEATYEAEVMETTDEMYLNKMVALREKQVKIAALDNSGANPTEHHPEGDCEKVHGKTLHDDWRKSHADSLKAQVKNEQFTNIIFANEAYMSQGAIEHVVAGMQAKDKGGEEGQKIIDALTPATVMQSINEQMADFFKDMKNSEGSLEGVEDNEKKREITGEAFVHASKYLVRLLDGAQLLVDKFAKIEPDAPLTFNLFQNVVSNKSLNTPDKLKKEVSDMLYALRKSAEIEASVKAELGIAEVQGLFNVSDIKGFRKIISDFCVEVNAKVRSSKTFKEGQTVDEKTEKEFFAGVS